MAYTITRGIVHHNWQKFVRDSSLALPLIAIVFIIVAALSFSTHQSSGQSPYIPPQKSAEQTTTSAGNAQPNAKPKASAKQTASSSSPAISTSPSQPALSSPAMSFGSLASNPTPISTQPVSGVTGGLGGGDNVSGSSGTSGTLSGSGGSGSGSGTSTPTVACTNLLSLAQVCTACTPTITLQPGQKALLSADGTCVAVN